MFVLGAFFTRSAGCAYNDWVDQDIDRRVERTKNRPLATGALNPYEVWAVIFFCLLCAFLCLLFMPVFVVILGVFLGVFILPYPLLKRFTNWPQLYLGLLFNSGVWLGYGLTHPWSFEPAILCLYIIGILWTLIYDTQYAYQDARDDAKIGMKSTALFWGEDPFRFFAISYGGILLLLLCLGLTHHLSLLFLVPLTLLTYLFKWQYSTFHPKDTASCYTLFLSHFWTGVLIALTLLAGFCKTG